MISLDVLPICRWRGPRKANGNYVCSSEKYVAKKGVPLEFCAERCYCVDHNPGERFGWNGKPVEKLADSSKSIRRVSLCVHFIDGKSVAKTGSIREWRLCEATGKEVCRCKNCTSGCEHYATESD